MPRALDDEAVAAWHAPATGTRGGQAVYSDQAIETEPALRVVLRQPLRKTKEALRPIADQLGVEIKILDHTTFSRRGGSLAILPIRIERNDPPHLLVDSAGVKIYGEGPTRSAVSGHAAAGGATSCGRRRHPAINALELTPDDVGDVLALPDLLDQIELSVESMTGDGGYESQMDALTSMMP